MNLKLCTLVFPSELYKEKILKCRSKGGEEDGFDPFQITFLSCEKCTIRYCSVLKLNVEFAVNELEIWLQLHYSSCWICCLNSRDLS